MSLSLDLNKPLGRAGLLLASLVAAAVTFAAAHFSYVYMTQTLPHRGLEKKQEALWAKVSAAAFAKAKAAAKGKAFDAEAAKIKADAEASDEIKKKEEELHHESEATWAPFSIFLLILSAILGAGLLGVYVQRRANDAGMQGLWLVPNHLGALALGAFIAFLPHLSKLGAVKAWALAPIAGVLLLLPVFLAEGGRSGHDHDHGHGHSHDHDHDHGHGHSH
ncbi:MAG: hypothetical protein ACO3ND_10185 [Opitutales bacterium]